MTVGRAPHPTPTPDTIHAMKNLLCLFALALVPACHSPNTPVEAVERDPNLAKVLYVGETSLMPSAEGIVLSNANGLLAVQARLRNGQPHERKLEYQWEWLDGRGVVVSSSSSLWTPIAIRPGEMASVQGTAPTPECVDFRLKLSKLPN